MKKQFFFLAALTAMLSIVGCSKQVSPEIVPEEGITSEERFKLKVGISGNITTKATGISSEDEKKINNVHVFAFRGDALDAYTFESGTDDIVLSCTAGEREIIVIANVDTADEDLSKVKTKTDLMSKVVYYSSNYLGNFTMKGSKSVNVPQTETVNIEVNRIVSRVVLSKISRNFTLDGLKTADFEINAIYLVNIPKTVNMGLTSTPTSWYNQGKFNNEFPDMTYEDQSMTIQNGSANNAYDHVFYTLPNNVDSSNEYCTRLVVQAVINETTYYYPISIPEIQANKSYVIENLTITRLGSDDPNDPVSISNASFDISVSDWTEVDVTDGVTI